MSGIQSREFVKDMAKTKHQKIALMHANGKAMALFEWMKFAMNKKNALIVSVETMGEIFGCSNRTIERHVSFLRSNKLLQIGKTGTSSIYSINPKVTCWNSKPTIFSMSAEVILTADESRGLARRVREAEKELKEYINARDYDE